MTPLAFPVIDLADGARFSSLVGDRTEWIVAHHGERDTRSFAGASLGGWDEMFPTITACTTPGGGGEPRDWSDHGDVWQQAWTGDQREHTVTVDDLTFTRTITRDGNALVFSYRVTSTRAQPTQWVAHPQFRWLPGATIDVGAEAIWHSVSPDDEPRSLRDDITPESLLDGKPCAKWWTEGVSAISLRQDGRALRLSWDPAVVRGVALWIDDEEFASERAIAIEPGLAPHDSLADAITDDSAPIVTPDAPLEWWLRIEETA